MFEKPTLLKIENEQVPAQCLKSDKFRLFRLRPNSYKTSIKVVRIFLKKTGHKSFPIHVLPFSHNELRYKMNRQYSNNQMNAHSDQPKLRITVESLHNHHPRTSCMRKSEEQEVQTSFKTNLSSRQPASISLDR